MTTKELINSTMLYEQHEVIRELKKHDSTLMQGLRNSDKSKGMVACTAILRRNVEHRERDNPLLV